MTATTLDKAALSQFSGGTENYYRHALMRSICYTDGVKYVAETYGAYWLIDKVATHQLTPRVRAEEFQVWKLTVTDKEAWLACEDGNGRNVIRRERIHFTDFPAPGIDLWFADGVIYLPCEH